MPYMKLANFEYDHIREFVHEMVAHISAEYKFKPVRAIFRNRQSSEHRFQAGQHLIVFGWQSAGYLAENGFFEYKSLQWLVPNPPPIGMRAVWQLVCHEMAHVPQTENGDRRYGVAHDRRYVEWYREIMTLFPYDDMVSLLMSPERRDYWSDRERRGYRRGDQ